MASHVTSELAARMGKEVKALATSPPEGVKYVETDAGAGVTTELYDLASDPYELHNLAFDPDHQVVQVLLARRLAELRAEADAAGGDDEVPRQRAVFVELAVVDRGQHERGDGDVGNQAVEEGQRVVPVVARLAAHAVEEQAHRDVGRRVR